MIDKPKFLIVFRDERYIMAGFSTDLDAAAAWARIHRHEVDDGDSIEVSKLSEEVIIIVQHATKVIYR